MNNKILSIIVGVFIVGFIAVLIISNRGGSYSNSELDAFAKCLAEKGVAMYGADWCPHCQNEKNAFGSSFRYINYIECPAEPKRCISAGIDGYPTWIFLDGKKLEGEQGLENLAKESGCILQKNTQ